VQQQLSALAASAANAAVKLRGEATSCKVTVVVAVVVAGIMADSFVQAAVPAGLHTDISLTPPIR